MLHSRAEIALELSVVIITFNEEKNIVRCLESVKSLADEIIIVDSFSTDNTKTLAGPYSVRFVQCEWQGYAQTKNYANSLATGDMILSLDADEALSDELIASIATIKSSGLKGVYSMNRLNNYCGQWIKHAGWYPDRKVRLFPKDGANWKGDVHERLVSSDRPIQVEGDILHYSYYSSEEHLERERKYAKIAAQRDGRVGGGAVGALLSVTFKFIKMYVLKGGFLEGRRGLILCSISSRSKWFKYQALKN